MLDILLEPFTYQYMSKAIFLCALVGSVCALLSSFLILKGWSLMGDALAHSIVPGVALAYLLSLPYSLGAFFTGILASVSMLIVKQKTKLREDATIGLVFTAFFAVGLLIISINPTAINIQSIILGNILAISDSDALQIIIMSLLCLLVAVLKWRDFLLVFFDKPFAFSIGIPVNVIYIIFFTLLSMTTVAALQAVGACLVIAMLVTPGATAYLITDKFNNLIVYSTLCGFLTSFLGAYLSYYVDINPGGLIVILQTIVFLVFFTFAPKYGFLKNRKIQFKRALDS